MTKGSVEREIHYLFKEIPYSNCLYYLDLKTCIIYLRYETI